MCVGYGMFGAYFIIISIIIIITIIITIIIVIIIDGRHDPSASPLTPSPSSPFTITIITTSAYTCMCHVCVLLHAVRLDIIHVFAHHFQNLKCCD